MPQHTEYHYPKSAELMHCAISGSIRSVFAATGEEERYGMHGLIFKLPQYFENIFTCMLRMLRIGRKAIVHLHSLHCIHL